MNIINSHSLLNYNTFKIDVAAKFFTTIYTEDDLYKLLIYKETKKEEKFVLGGGSNILLTQNMNKLVIYNQIKGIKVIQENDKKITIEVGGGEKWDDVVSWSTNRNLYGIENLSLIPGSMGAAPIQNIGAYGCEIRDTFKQLEAIHLETHEKIIFTQSDCQFGYRDSIFKNKLRNQFIITKVQLELMKIKKINIEYKGIKDKIKDRNINSNNIRETIISIRKNKLPNYLQLGNAGSFFKNPLINSIQLKKIQERYPNIPFYQANSIKIPAAWLIEKLNWKGYKENTCGVYQKHALILINHNYATGKEIQNLAKKIKKSVYNEFNIKLEEEVSII